MDSEQPGASSSDPKKELSRRSFIKGVGLALGGAALGPTLGKGEETASATGATAGIRAYEGEQIPIRLRVNGTDVDVRIRPADTLASVLREKLGLTGTKVSCERGACGSCTVLLNGASVNSCMLLALDAVDAEITSIEGLSTGERLHPIQQAFADNDACQCGCCIPGFIMRSHAMLAENPSPSLDEIKQGLGGNLCRCAAYPNIFKAVRSVQS